MGRGLTVAGCACAAGVALLLGSRRASGPLMVDEHGYAHSIVHGVVYPPFLREGDVDKLRRGLELRPSDVVIAAYPKCGTTWLQQIVLALVLRDAAGVVEPQGQAPWLEPNAASLAGRGGDTVKAVHDWRGLTQPRVWKTHAPYGLRPWRSFGGKTLVITRNPKDTCVSMFHHARRKRHIFRYDGNMSHFVSLFVDGRVASGCFWEWHASWLHAGEANTLWVSYEELQADLEGGVRRVAAFLGVPAPDEGLVAAVVASAAFAAMQARQSPALKALQHVRRGLVGAWRDELPAAAVATLDRAHAERASALNLSYIYQFDPS